MKQRSDEAMALVEHAVTRIRDAGSYWQGEAYYAAYDRVAGDRDHARKAAQEIEALAQTLTDSGDLLTGYRQTLLDKVTEATAAGFTVADDWTLTAADNSDIEQARTHRTAVSSALDEMLAVHTNALTGIEQANADLTTQAEQHAAASTPTSPISQVLDSTPTAPDKTTPASAAAPASTNAEVPNSSKQAPAGSPTSAQSAAPATSSPSPVPTGNPAADTKKTNSNPGAANNSAATQITDKGKPGEWRPGDISDLIKAVSTITGTMPDLIDSSGEFLQNVGELVKNGSEAIADVTDSITELITAVDQMTHDTNVAPEQPAMNNPADSSPVTSPSAGTAAPASSDKPATTEPTAPGSGKTHAADWTPPTTTITTTTTTSTAQSTNNSSTITSQPVAAPGLPIVAAAPRNSSTERALSSWSLDLPNPALQESSQPPVLTGATNS